MVGRQPALRLLIELKHREIRYPDGAERSISSDLLAEVAPVTDHLIRNRGDSMPVSVTPSQFYAKIPRRRIDAISRSERWPCVLVSLA